MTPQASAQQTTHDDRGADDQRSDAPTAADSLRKTLTAKNRVHTVVPETARAAREQVGLSLEEAIRRSKLEHLAELEAGQWHPTYAQLDYLAKVYMVPAWALQVHELPEVARFNLQVPEFRRFKNVEPEFDYETRRLLSNVESMREIVIELSTDLDLELETFDPPVRLPSDGKISDDELLEAAGEIVSWLGLGDVTVKFDERRSAVEHSGVHVFCTSPYSHWSKIDRRKFRGFAVPKDPLPILVVNGSDVPGDRSFTLFHELAHLLTKTVNYDSKPVVDHGAASEAVEIMCDRFAACVLWRGARWERLKSAFDTSKMPSVGAFEKIASEHARKAELNSWSAAIRLRQTTALSDRQFVALNRHYVSKGQQPKAKSSGGGARNRRREVRRQFGERYFSTIMSAYHARKVTLVTACQMMELNIPQLLSGASE